MGSKKKRRKWKRKRRSGCCRCHHHRLKTRSWKVCGRRARCRSRPRCGRLRAGAGAGCGAGGSWRQRAGGTPGAVPQRCPSVARRSPPNVGSRAAEGCGQEPMPSPLTVLVLAVKLHSRRLAACRLALLALLLAPVCMVSKQAWKWRLGGRFGGAAGKDPHGLPAREHQRCTLRTSRSRDRPRRSAAVHRAAAPGCASWPAVVGGGGRASKLRKRVVGGEGMAPLAAGGRR